MVNLKQIKSDVRLDSRKRAVAKVRASQDGHVLIVDCRNRLRTTTDPARRTRLGTRVSAVRPGCACLR